MKISEFEELAIEKYGAKKMENIEDAISLFNYPDQFFKKDLHFCCAFVCGDDLEYVCSKDGKNVDKIITTQKGHINGVLNNIFADLNVEYYMRHQKPIQTIDEMDNYYLKDQQVKKMYWNELTEKQQNKYNDLIFFETQITPEGLTEGEIYPDELYAIYVFDDEKISKNLYGFRVETGFCSTFIVIATENGEDISNYYAMQSGRIPENDFQDFLDNIFPEPIKKGKYYE